jgi:hypothetical protein
VIYKLYGLSKEIPCIISEYLSSLLIPLNKGSEVPVLPQEDQERILEICRKRKVLIKRLCGGDVSRATFPFFVLFR